MQRGRGITVALANDATEIRLGKCPAFSVPQVILPAGMPETQDPPYRDIGQSMPERITGSRKSCAIFDEYALNRAIFSGIFLAL
jgi:hypothetical protein